MPVVKNAKAMGMSAGGGSGSDNTKVSVLSFNNNVLTTTVTADPAAFVLANAPAIAAVDIGYDTLFKGVSPSGKAQVEYVGTPNKDYEFKISGTVTSEDPAFLGEYIGVRLQGQSQGLFTGGAKFYPVGVSFGPGASAALGFDLSVYGRFPAGEVIEILVSSNNAGDIILNECIIVITPIEPDTE